MKPLILLVARKALILYANWTITKMKKSSEAESAKFLTTDSKMQMSIENTSPPSTTTSTFYTGMKLRSSIRTTRLRVPPRLFKLFDWVVYENELRHLKLHLTALLTTSKLRCVP